MAGCQPAVQAVPVLVRVRALVQGTERVRRSLLAPNREHPWSEGAALCTHRLVPLQCVRQVAPRQPCLCLDQARILHWTVVLGYLGPCLLGMGAWAKQPVQSVQYCH